MPICYRCKRDRPRYKDTMLCKTCYEHARRKRRSYLDKKGKFKKPT